MFTQQLPFERKDDKVILTGPVFLSCGCGNVIARWASISQNLVTKIPQAKPKSSKIVHDWIEQEGLSKKWPVLKLHSYGIVVVETNKGLEMLNVMSGATQKVASDIGALLARRKDV